MGRFLTRDPTGYQAGPNMYAYCENNPITRCDPSGCVIVPPTSAQALQDWNTAVEYLNKSKTFKNEYNILNKSKNIYRIVITNISDPHKGIVDEFDPSSNNTGGGTINWNPYVALHTLDNKASPTGHTMNPSICLGHELGHAWDDEADPKGYERRAGQSDPYYTNEEEEWNTVLTENPEEGELGLAKRTNHWGNVFKVSGPTAYKDLSK